MRIALILILVSIFQACFSQVDTSRIDWKTDIEFLKKELPARHTDFFSIRTQEEFEKELNEIISKLEYLDDEEIIFALQQVIASFGDSHTHVDYSKLFIPKKNLPIKLYWFKKGLYIIETSNANKSLLGKRITAINKYSVSQICDSLKTVFTVDNEAIVKIFVPELIKNKDLLEYFGFVKNGFYEFEVESTNVTKRYYKLDLKSINKNNSIKIRHHVLS
jgi:hypothetical protein